MMRETPWSLRKTLKALERSQQHESYTAPIYYFYSPASHCTPALPQTPAVKTEFNSALRMETASERGLQCPDSQILNNSMIEGCKAGRLTLLTGEKKTCNSSPRLDLKGQ